MVKKRVDKKNLELNQKIKSFSIILFILVVLLIFSIYLLMSQDSKEFVLLSPSVKNCTDGCLIFGNESLIYEIQNKEDFNITLRNYDASPNKINITISNYSTNYTTNLIEINESFIAGDYNFTIKWIFDVIDINSVNVKAVNFTFVLLEDRAIQDVRIQCDVGYSINLTSCFNDRKIEYPEVYNVTQGCTLANVTIPFNKTIFSDCNDNKIIGLKNDVITKDLDFDIFIDEKKINNSKKYNGTRLIEFVKGGISILEFDFDFSNTLDLTKIRLEMHDNVEDDFGYLLVEGLAGEEKIFRVEKIDSDSDSVCIKDRSGLGNISTSISRKCNGNGEINIECDGQEHEGFECNIREINDEEYFAVSNLRNSGVREILRDIDDSGSSGNLPNRNSNVNTNVNRTNANTGVLRNIEKDSVDFDDEIDLTQSEFNEDKSILWVIMGFLIFAIFVVGFVLIVLIVKKGEKKDKGRMWEQQGVIIKSQPLRREGF